MEKQYLSKYEISISEIGPIDLALNTLKSVKGKLILTKYRMIFVPERDSKQTHDPHDFLIPSEFIEIPKKTIYDILILGKNGERSYLTSKKVFQKENIVFVCKNARNLFFITMNISADHMKIFLKNLLFVLLNRRSKLRHVPTKNVSDTKRASTKKLTHLLSSLKVKSNKSERPNLPTANFFIERVSECELYIPSEVKSDDNLYKKRLNIPALKSTSFSSNMSEESYSTQYKSLESLKYVWTNALFYTGAFNFYYINYSNYMPLTHKYNSMIVPIKPSINYHNLNSQFISNKGTCFSYFYRKYETVLYSSGTLKNQLFENKSENLPSQSIQSLISFKIPEELAEIILPTNLINRNISAICVEDYFLNPLSAFESYIKLTKLCTSIGCKKIKDKLKKKSPSKNKMNDSEVLKKYSKKKFFLKLQNTKWLNHISKILSLTNQILLLLKTHHVVITEKETAYTCIISSLVKIMIDPFFRSPMGFWHLIHQDWMSNNYNFSYYLNDCNKYSKIFQPIFLLFLDCVHQIWNQFSHEFNFNSNFIVAVSDAVASGMFSSFNDASNKNNINDVNFDIFELESYWKCFENPYYYFNKSNNALTLNSEPLIPTTFHLSLVIWEDYFFRWTPGYTQINNEFNYQQREIIKLLKDLRIKKSINSLQHIPDDNIRYIYQNPKTFVYDILTYCGHQNL